VAAGLSGHTVGGLFLRADSRLHRDPRRLGLVAGGGGAGGAGVPALLDMVGSCCHIQSSRACEREQPPLGGQET
jgi:hypothetical protein